MKYDKINAKNIQFELNNSEIRFEKLKKKLKGDYKD